MAPGLPLFLYDAGHEEAALRALEATPMDRIMAKRWKRLAGYPDMAAAYPRLFTDRDLSLAQAPAQPSTPRREDG